jgi:thermostable 8-oxoguanine DNA glycosylase
VTIDKWHIRACLCKPREGIVDTTETITSAQYRRVEAITARIAEEHKLKAYEAQAIIWVTIKEGWGR